VKNTGTWTVYIGDSEGGIDLWQRYSETLSSFSGELIKRKSWARVHNLRISNLYVSHNEGILISISFDCGCKILNGLSGQVLFTIENPRSCMYTCVFYESTNSTLFLVDEVGYLELFSTLYEKTIGSKQIVFVTQQQLEFIVKSHQGPALGKIIPYVKEKQFLVLKPFDGLVSCIEISSNTFCKEFKFEDEPILLVEVFNPVKNKGPPTKSSSHMNVTKISQEENLIFTMTQSHISVRDESDKKGVNKIKNSLKSEISASCIIWNYNSIVTGHDDGKICLINFDSNSKSTYFL
jgi:hypothetical protein